MEPVTHFLTGACLARAGFNRRTAYATLAMTLAAEAPDLDVLWGFAGPVAAFEHHRGITHTFLGAPFVALAVTGVVYAWHHLRESRESHGSAATRSSQGAPNKPSSRSSGPEPNWFLLWLFSLIAALSHLLLDFTNNYGLRPFFPFNPRWYSWDIVFIYEPLMWIALIAALLMPSIFGLADREIGAQRQPFRGRGWAIAALAFIAVLYTVRNAEHQRALNLLRANTLVEPTLRVAAEPNPLNPFHWQGLAETADFYQTAAIDTRADSVDTDSGQVFYKPPVTLATLTAKRSWLGRAYLDWSSWPLVTDLGSQPAPGAETIPNLPLPIPLDWHTVEFRDLRFSSTTLPLRNASAPPLSGSVYIGPNREVEAMVLSGREQK
ncbi:Membrane-bound metal-dependent hydrolase [Acidisarcina polymorpha]|uniref:Membrane-bound metal-dependent hydrolase n=1 Tax=Acidisarcina polymorpha TaxID=2211140 RepID=A0A2Z5FY01_9BACT|nr:metal-dependent hydrolase [Acidisarcina polymorpha]AXC11682.1 Membrane-bound metal-dependent hydrolase [Acidisarcina polymorpha]